MYRRAQKGIGYLPQGGERVPQAERGGQHPGDLEMTKLSSRNAKRSWNH